MNNIVDRADESEIASTETTVAETKVGIEIALDKRINFALQQNDVPVVKALQIHNHSDLPLRDIRVVITSDPDFAKDWEAAIDLIAPQSQYNLHHVDLSLSARYLYELTERVAGQLQVRVMQGSEVFAQSSEKVSLLARDEWGGLSSLPQILAAFVLPNHPALSRVLSTASSLLKDWTDDSSLNGYQSQNPARIRLMTGAVYEAIRQEQITYSNPPASFEEDGQRVRFPDRILGADGQLATCLDLALLTAACLEQIGLHPLIVIVEGHAFSGVWLTEDSFSDAVMYDPVRLRKRCDERDQILVFDPTAATNSPSLDFDKTIPLARQRLDESEKFYCVLDVTRSRKSGIRPIPERVAVLSEDGSGQKQPDTPDAPATLTIPDIPKPLEGGEVQESPASRLDKWQSKLLDLSLRNRLLNFKNTKKTLPLKCHDLSGLEDLLASGKVFDLLPKPRELDAADPRNIDLHRQRTGEDALVELLSKEQAAGRLYFDLTPTELSNRAVTIFREARTAMEESGANTLYLAVGFLTWYENETSEMVRKAPILLLPVALKRESTLHGFKLQQIEDDPRLNVTLLELLKKDFGIEIKGLDPLPHDESGLDVPMILNAFRKAIREIDRWEVEEEAQVGFFSFAKFLMWRDLVDRAESLVRNPVVDHLVNHPHDPFDPDAEFPEPSRLDDDRRLTETFCPLDSDSSQLAAVFAASEGRSFVLEGPPGTGKSQTITNLIAHSLANGKTVLFVSEKMAALNVVHRRLSKKLGLGQFCLELHSNKAEKRRVIEQLANALNTLDKYDPTQWEREAQRIEELRRELNEYVRTIHRRRATGETFFQAVSRLIGTKDVPCLRLGWTLSDRIDVNRLASLRDVVDRLAITGAECGALVEHPLKGIQHTDWSPSWEDEVERSTRRFLETLADLENAVSALVDRFHLTEFGECSLDYLDLIDRMAELFINPPQTHIGLLQVSNWPTTQERIQSIVSHGRRRDKLRNLLREYFKDEILELDLDSLQQQLAKAKDSWSLFAWWRRRPIYSALATVAKDGEKPVVELLGSILEQATDWRAEQHILDEAAAEAEELLGPLWNKGEADWQAVTSATNHTDAIRRLIMDMTGEDFDRGAELRLAWSHLLDEGHELLQSGGPIWNKLETFRQARTRFLDQKRALVDLASADTNLAWGSEEENGVLPLMGERLESWLAANHQLRNWCAWQRARSDAVQLELQPIVEAYETGQIESSQIRRVFDRSYDEWWVKALLDSEEILRRFQSVEHERKIKLFREIDDHYMELTKSLVQAKLGEKVPNSAAGNFNNSEIGILRREAQKKRRHMAVRQLFQKIPNLLPRLKPCMLMSPISVAQYLDSEYPPFDVVVFDEASQIPVWDAVGALARGKQAIIVGDPKQLPPTNFFQRADNDDEEHDPEDDVPEDLESILDDCMGAGIPQLRLDWHYRSRHESLITFSNYNYYENRLFTFPSPDLSEMGVQLRPVPKGIYDKGKSRTNKLEAEAVVNEILRRLDDATLARFTIGVVTFSQAQQKLIEDLLDEARRENPELDHFFSDEIEEPVFVKNLENVQGDERDIILFSICYGPDLTGRVAMNFGPINRDGGERRLNVAITRARYEVLVFSTLRADQIDLARTNKRGVQDLKLFLEYADRGLSAIAEAVVHHDDADFDSPFEEEVYNALVRQGHEVHKQVGCARYRIDLAIIDPEATGRYLLGIECDGANYHRAKTARDRDKLRESVLRGLGWELHRIWSTDWWANPDRELEKLREAIEAAKQKAKEILKSTPAPVAATQAKDSPRQMHDPGPAHLAQLLQPSLLEYRPVHWQSKHVSSPDFFDTASTRDMRDRLEIVVKREGPISLSLAAKRIAPLWGVKRVTERVLKHVRANIPQSDVHVQRTDGDVFLWPDEQAPNQYDSFRVPGPNSNSHRDIMDIPLEEIANAAFYLVENNVSAPQDEMVRETARLFGIQRVGKKVDDRIRKAIHNLKSKRRIEIDGEIIVLLNN